MDKKSLDYVAQLRYDDVAGWVDVALAGTLRDAAHAAALAYADHARHPFGVRVIRRHRAAQAA